MPRIPESVAGILTTEALLELGENSLRQSNSTLSSWVKRSTWTSASVMQTHRIQSELVRTNRHCGRNILDSLCCWCIYSVAPGAFSIGRSAVWGATCFIHAAGRNWNLFQEEAFPRCSTVLTCKVHKSEAICATWVKWPFSVYKTPFRKHRNLNWPFYRNLPKNSQAVSIAHSIKPQLAFSWLSDICFRI